MADTETLRADTARWFEEYQRTGDREVRNRIVEAHRHIADYYVRRYERRGVPHDDLLQVSLLSIVRAAERFDPGRGVRLVSFAVHWIRAEIHEFILRNWRIVKVATTKAQRKLFFNLRRQKKRLGWLNQAEVNRVAQELGVKPEVVTEMESRLAGQDIGFDLTDDDDESGFVAPAAYLEGLTVSPHEALEAQDWEEHHQNLLFDGIEALDDRSRDIIQSRWLMDPKITLQELADKYGVSAERIRQLENVALKKLKAHFAA